MFVRSLAGKQDPYYYNQSKVILIPKDLVIYCACCGRSELREGTKKL